MQLIYYLISLKFSLVFFSVQVKYLILSIYIYYILGLGAGQLFSGSGSCIFFQAAQAPAPDFFPSGSGSSSWPWVKSGIIFFPHKLQKNIKQVK